MISLDTRPRTPELVAWVRLLQEDGVEYQVATWEDGVAFRIAHLMRHAGQQWHALWSMSFPELCGVYATFRVYVDAEIEAQEKARHA